MYFLSQQMWSFYNKKKGAHAIFVHILYTDIVMYLLFLKSILSFRLNWPIFVFCFVSLEYACRHGQ